MIHPIRTRLLGLAVALAWTVPAPVASASVSSELAFHRGVVAFGDERWDEARAEFETVVAEDPEDTAALQYLGLIAQEEGEFQRAVEYYDRALAVDPEDEQLRLDRASALLELGDLEAAKGVLEELLKTRPDDPRANLFAGIAAYRSGQYQVAMERLDRAKQLDPSLEAHATYYAGLSAAFLGNFDAADGALASVEQQSPLSPLSLSARSLRQQMSKDDVVHERRWSLSLSAGAEWDTNPTFAGRSNPLRPPGTPDFGDQDDDFRGVFRIRGSYDVIDAEPYQLAVGYDGYLSKHHRADEVDLQTHVGWLAGSVNLDPVRLGLRYDYAFTMIDLTDEFRSLNRITPSATLREGDWGVAQLFFQWQNEQFLQDLPSIFDRDANRYTVGINQFLFFPGPFSYLRVGALGEFARADEPDFSFDGLEVSAGASVALPLGVEWTVLYRFLYRDYRSINALPADWVSGRMAVREDFIHRLTIEFVRAITEHLEASIASSHTFQDSNIDAYEYNRHVVGGYLTYHF